jgi:predicted transcriptional regulator
LRSIVQSGIFEEDPGITTKERARKVIDSLPEDAGLDEIMHALYINAKFHKGEKEIREGKGVSHEEAKKRMKKWRS